MVSIKTKKILYDIACGAIHLKMEEESYQQVLGNVSKSCNIQQEYANALWELDIATKDPDK